MMTATNTKHQQKLLHNVGLKAIVKGLIHDVMRSSSVPDSPEKVADLLDHMRGIPWHESGFQGKKDDWVNPLAEGLKEMYNSKGIGTKNKKYQLELKKRDKKNGNVIDTFTLNVSGW
jgi:hypothetical protein